MWVGIGVGIGRNRFATGIFNDYALRVTADGGITEAGQCVDAVTGILLNASLLLIPSGYKGGKLYSEIPTNGNGDLTWTRGSDAFRTNASGVIQRVPWNLVQYSQDFDNATGWTIISSRFTYSKVTGPTGINNAFSFVEVTQTDSHNIYASTGNRPTSTSGTTYTISAFFKQGTRRYCGISVGSAGSGVHVFLDTTNWAITDAKRFSTNTNWVYLSSNVESVGNDWYRLSLTFRTDSALALIGSIFASNVSTSTLGEPSYLGDGSTIITYGAQLVEGTTAQTYLPTTDRLNFPRLSYMYGSCPAVLLEPQRTNLMWNSGDFQNASWGKSAFTFNSTETAPDGTLSARNYTTTASFAYVLQVNTVTSGSLYTSSVFLKYTSGVGSFAVRFSDNTSTNFISVTVNLTNGTIGSVSYGGNGANGSATITTLTNGWYRVSITGSILGTSAGLVVTNLGLGNTTFSIWGGQVEAGAYPTTYIPTTSATATRVADSFSRSNIYTNGLISASGGTWFVELRNNIAYTLDASEQGINLGDNATQTLGNQLQIRSVTANERMVISKRVANLFTQLYVTTTNTTKIAIKWNGATADVFANGTKVVSATSFTATALEFLTANVLGTPKFIQQMALFPSPLSDTDCATLTT